MEDEIRKLLGLQLLDAYSAERQALRAMQRIKQVALSTELKDAIQTHIEETETQIERVQSALEALKVQATRHTCEAMRGLVDEAMNDAEMFKSSPVLDVVIIASLQRIEHYEIAAYGTAIAIADAIGQDRVVELLEQTLEEEKTTDEKLTDLTQESILPSLLKE